MRAILPVTLCLLALSGCGGLENEPLTYGLLRGTLEGATSASSVSVYGRPDLLAVPDATGAYSLRVPQGEVEVLALISDLRVDRFPVTVKAGQISDLGARAGQAPGRLELELHAPSFQRIVAGTVMVDGTPLAVRLEHPDEWEFRLPTGCYQITATVPGLGSVSTQACANGGGETEVPLHLPAPDGSPGHEGCSVTGCLDAYSCQLDGACR